MSLEFILWSDQGTVITATLRTAQVRMVILSEPFAFSAPNQGALQSPSVPEQPSSFGKKKPEGRAQT